MDIPRDVVDKIRKLTRECTFDFDRVAHEINLYIAENMHTGFNRCLTSKNCREIFAFDYSSSETSFTSIKNSSKVTSVTEVVEDSEKPKMTKVVENNSISEEIFSTTPSEISQENTFHDLMLLHERRQAENNKKMEDLFNRVLISLDTGVRASDIEISEDIILAQRMRREEKERILTKKKLDADLKAEQEFLKLQRMALKSRFEEGSVDAEGIDPLGDAKETVTMEQDLEDDVSVTQVQVVDFMLNNPQFDDILSAIEQDLETAAMGKNEMSSELSEILAILDAEVVSRKHIEGNARWTLGSQNEAIDSSFSNQVYEKMNETEDSKVDRPNVATVTCCEPKTKPLTTKAMPVVKDSTVKVNSRTAKRDTPNSGEDAKISDSGSEDDEDNWRGMRQKLKSAAIVPQDKVKVDYAWGAYRSGSENTHVAKVAVDQLQSQTFVSECDEIINSDRDAVDDDDADGSERFNVMDAMTTGRDLSISSESPSVSSVLDIDDGERRSLSPENFTIQNNDYDYTATDNGHYISNDDNIAVCVDAVESEDARTIKRVDVPAAVDSTAICAETATLDSVNGSSGGILASMENRKRDTSRKAAKRGERLVGSVENARMKRDKQSNTGQDDMGDTAVKSQEHSIVIREEVEEVEEVAVIDAASVTSIVDGSTDFDTEEVCHDTVVDILPEVSSNFPPIVPEFISNLFDHVNKGIESQANILKELGNVVILQFNLCDIPQVSNTSDVLVYGVVSWLILKLKSLDSKLISIQLTSLEVDIKKQSAAAESDAKVEISDRRILLLVAEANTYDASIYLVQGLTHDIRNVTVGDVLLHPDVTSTSDNLCFEKEHDTNISSHFTILSQNQIVSVLSKMSLPPTPSRHRSVNHQVDSQTVACCVIKPYILQNSPRVLSAICDQCEANGLRICGLRTAYIDVHDTNVLHALLVDSSAELNQHMNPTPSLQTATSTTCKLPVLVICYYHTTLSPLETLRRIIGPEDPTLAKATDPKSLRAVWGESRKLNLTFALSHISLNSWKHSQLWFSPRNFDAESKERKKQSNTGVDIFLPREQYLTVACAHIYSSPMEFTSYHNCLLSENQCKFNDLLQRNIVGCVDLVSVDMVNENVYRSYSTKENVDSELSLACYFVYQFQTCSSSLCIRAIEKQISNDIVKLHNDNVKKNSPWILRANFQYKSKLNTLSLSNNVAAAIGEQSNRVNASFKFSQNNFGSHEDVGLHDVVVCSIDISPTEADQRILNREPTPSFGLFFLKFLQSFQKNCFPTIIGVHSVASNCDHFERISFCIRGYQVIENIDRAVDVALASIFEKQNEFIRSNRDVASFATAHRSKIKIYRGKKAFDIVMKEFDVSQPSFLKAFACLDVAFYVPRSPDSTIGLDSPKQRGYRNTFSDSTEIFLALFPNGQFCSLSVVLLPYLSHTNPHNRLSVTNLLFRILKRLEKEKYSIYNIGSIRLDVNDLKICADEALYEASMMYQESNYDNKWTELIRQWFQSLKNQDLVAIVVGGNSALRTLRHVLGPINPLDAMRDVPASLIASIASQHVIDVDHCSQFVSPSLFYSLTCRTTQNLIEKLAPISMTIESAMQCTPLVAGESFFHIKEYSPNVDTSSQFQLLLQALRDESKKEYDLHHGSKDLVADIKNATTELTCLVVTQPLIEAHGIAAIMQVLHKECFKVVHVKTSYLHFSTAKKLLELAGQSSLSMKPAVNTLLKGPCFIVALEGTSHSILRLKQLFQQPLSDVVPLMSSSISTQYHKNTMSSLGKLPDGSWGVLMSSSTRLARDLLLYCFNNVINSSFHIEISPQLSQCIPVKEFVAPVQEPIYNDDKISLPPPALRQGHTNLANIEFKTPPESPTRVTQHQTTSSIFYTPLTSAKSTRVKDEDELDLSSVPKCDLKGDGFFVEHETDTFLDELD